MMVEKAENICTDVTKNLWLYDDVIGENATKQMN